LSRFLHRGCLALAALLVCTPSLAQGVAPAIQAATFDKIFDFDRALSDRVKLKVLVVFDPAVAGQKDAAAALQKAFTGASIGSEPVPVATAAAKLAPGSVLYLMPGTNNDNLLKAAAGAKTLTIAGEAAPAEQGKVSVGLAPRGDKAEIVVNVDRVAVEGHDFSAQLLNFARVIRGSGGAATASKTPEPAPAPVAGGSGGGDNSTPPILVKLNKPEYPELARKMRVEGEVVMRLSVDDSGKVVNVELMKGVGRGNLDEVAMNAARAARFRPATHGGAAVAGTYVLTIPFRL
jgi:TonB family protein